MARGSAVLGRRGAVFWSLTSSNTCCYMEEAMQNFARFVGPEAGKAVALAVPGIVGALVAEPLILAALAGGLLVATGVVLGVGVRFVGDRAN